MRRSGRVPASGSTAQAASRAVLPPVRAGVIGPIANGDEFAIIAAPFRLNP